MLFMKCSESILDFDILSCYNYRYDKFCGKEPFMNQRNHTGAARVLISFLLSLQLLLFVSCSCGASAQKTAAEAILDRVIACDASQLAAIMGSDITALSDMEQFTLRRMEYKIISAEKIDETHWDVTADTRLYDLMALFNEAFLYVYDSEDAAVASTVSTWALEKLNQGDVETGCFRAVVPLVDGGDGSWELDEARVGDDLRDAVTGGAYSWYQAYEEVFGNESDS